MVRPCSEQQPTCKNCPDMDTRGKRKVKGQKKKPAENCRKKKKQRGVEAATSAQDREMWRELVYGTNFFQGKKNLTQPKIYIDSLKFEK